MSFVNVRWLASLGAMLTVVGCAGSTPPANSDDLTGPGTEWRVRGPQIGGNFSTCANSFGDGYLKETAGFWWFRRANFSYGAVKIPLKEDGSSDWESPQGGRWKISPGKGPRPAQVTML